jgi:hypothetical protein
MHETHYYGNSIAVGVVLDILAGVPILAVGHNDKWCIIKHICTKEF